MKFTRDAPTSVWGTRLAQTDGRYRAWLGEVSDVSIRLTGTRATDDVTNAPVLRRAFLDRLTPYEAVKRVQAAYLRRA